ncbi:ABC transporter substrate-binding protein [Oerskovia enterophila]|uniref:Oligopeptide-binding protein AppA n=1 Tax=Oerskovia enterophila TaxID=43678 RepID=A0A163RNP4_9CELL|nr:ABC transporter substrate-binding protein [Oerskovia enterophila]KZM35529.1 oligopeptide-binding protein AppA precursor [Oerskovia enterophila]
MIRSKGRKRLLTAVALASGLTLLATGCGTSGDDGDQGTASKGDGVLTVWAGSQTPIVANFNPYAPTVLHAALGGVYETLFYFNKASSDAPQPMLGESYEFNEDGTELTIKIREGVTWNDGKPFTAEDVVYSFSNETSKPVYLASAEVVDPTTVKLTFTGPQFTNEFALLGASWMVPEHIWKDVPDTISFANEKPVGTGPYTVASTSDASYSMVANPDYWGGAPAVEKVQYLGIDANTSAESLLKTGKIDWAGMFVADPESLTKDGRLGYINTPQDPTVLYTCANADAGCVGAQTDVAVRQALNVAIDRGVINEKAFVGLAAEISPTFALLGRDDKWISPDVEKVSPQEANAAEAGKILEAAGYTKGADGIYEKDGKKLELKLISVEGWSDYNAAADLIAAQAKTAGIAITAETATWDEFSDARQTGGFELIMGGVVGTSVPDPFQIYRDWFSGEYTQPVGTQLESGEWNFSRYSNPTVDAAVNAAAATNDEAAKKAAYATIQTEITRDLPYIPIVINATQTFFDQKDFTGWPTEDDLYAFPPSWGSVSAGVVLSTIKPAE